VRRPSFVLFGRSPGRERPSIARDPRPDWKQADPRKIEAALQHALTKPSGGWAVLDASRRITDRPRPFTIAGVELVVWRDHEGRVHAGPDRCPHMGARLCQGHVDGTGKVVCPWHGLALGERAFGRWRPLDTHDDGVLTWIQMPQLLAPGEAFTAAPVLPDRPDAFLDGVIRMEARCAPRDVLANRLDPWHGAHFHPHSFLRLFVLDEHVDQVTVRVVYKVVGPLGMEVDARFHCPDSRTIVMTITGGEGKGSVVETHATPLSDGRTAVIEATLATSERQGFGLARRLNGLVRPLIEARAARLWVEDVEYAERTYALRQQDAVDAAKRRERRLRVV
jgi:hypothetical protein